MSDTDALALQHSGLNTFLFAEIDVEPSGMPLSVLSAFARLDLDPWQEAGRLASLSGRAAVEALATTISKASPRPVGDAAVIARRLLELLPGRRMAAAGTPAAEASTRDRRIVRSALAIMLVMLVAAGLISGGAMHRGAGGAAPAGQAARLVPTAN